MAVFPAIFNSVILTCRLAALSSFGERMVLPCPGKKSAQRFIFDKNIFQKNYPWAMADNRFWKNFSMGFHRWSNLLLVEKK